MTDPKKTEDQELSLDQLKDAAGGSTAMGYGTLTAMVAVSPIGSAQTTGNRFSTESLDTDLDGDSSEQDNLIGSANPGGDDI